MDADYAVVGVGAMGSFALWELAKQGKSVLGFDRYPPGHDKGSSHGDTRIHRTAYKAGDEYLPYLFEAGEIWKNLNELTGTEIYTQVGSLMIADERSDILGPAFKGSEDYDLAYDHLKGLEAQTRFPQHHFKRNDELHYDYEAGFVRPELAIQTVSQLAIDEGARLHIGRDVEKIEVDDSGVTIHYGEEEYRVGHVIVAAGSWINDIMPEFDFPLEITRQILFWFRAYEPEQFMPEHFPVFSRETGEHNWYGFPTIDGKTVKIAIHDHGKEVKDPNKIDREVRDEDKGVLPDLIRSYFPGLDPDPVAGKVCTYTNTPKDRFLLGPTSKAQNTTVLGGGSGHGFKFAPVLGKLAAESAAGLPTSLDIDMFDPDRFD